MTRICSRCRKEKRTDEFSACNQKLGRKCHGVECRECKSKRTKVYHFNNKARNNAAVMKWRLENKERARDAVKRWAEANPERARESWRRAQRKTRKNTKNRISRSIATGILRSIRQGTKAGRRWEDLVGYTIGQLRIHLEKRFTPEMTWENYGTYWHIDHKTPVAVFNFNRPEDIDFRICWSLKNLQPLEATENRIKRCKIDAPFQPSLAMGA